MDPLQKFTADATLLEDPSSYRRLIGRLLYLVISRPDICYAVQRLSQYVSAPTNEHLQAAHTLLRYLKHTPGQGILFSAKSDLQLHAYADADWASSECRKSTSGWCVFMGESLLTWKSKKQQTVSRSSAEAEYRSLASVTCEVIWLHNLLLDFGITKQPTLLYCDNKAAIHIATNPTFHERTKHVEIDLHFVREKVENGDLKLIHVRSNHQLADLLTKALPRAAFLQLLSKMGITNIFLPS